MFDLTLRPSSAHLDRFRLTLCPIIRLSQSPHLPQLLHEYTRLSRGKLTRTALAHVRGRSTRTQLLGLHPRNSTAQLAIDIVEKDVVDAVYDVTRGQPGLVGWFGELLTQKYNPGKDKLIDKSTWRHVYTRALQVEFNNTVMNIVAKARGIYRSRVLSLFMDPNVPFWMDKDWCGFLYMNGIIDEVIVTEKPDADRAVCRFSNPFIQHRL